jgi:hypothetical protein
MKKTTRITIETERVLTLTCGGLGRMWCERCASEAGVIPLEILGSLVAGGPPKIHEWIESSALHCFAPDQGPVRVCHNSLLRVLGPETP